MISDGFWYLKIIKKNTINEKLPFVELLVKATYTFLYINCKLTFDTENNR